MGVGRCYRLWDIIWLHMKFNQPYLSESNMHAACKVFVGYMCKILDIIFTDF